MQNANATAPLTTLMDFVYDVGMDFIHDETTQGKQLAEK